MYYTLTGKWWISGSAGTPFYLIDQEKGTYLTKFLKVEVDRKMGICHLSAVESQICQRAPAEVMCCS